LLKDDELHFTIVKTQVQNGKTHHKILIGWGFFVVNDNLHVDLMNT
jgi:hypothetical protein